MKILFLDFDGVLKPEGPSWASDEYGGLFYADPVRALAQIVKDTDAHIVASSDWRKSGLDILLEMWDRRKLPGMLVGVIPVREDADRGEEIKEWLSVHPEVTSYCVLDDVDCSEPWHQNNFVLVEVMLDENTASSVTGILNS